MIDLIGEAIVAGAVAGVLVGLYVAEIIYAPGGWHAHGERAVGWTGRNRWFAVALVVAIGVVLAHFALNAEVGG